jgi:hypothetical protein
VVKAIFSPLLKVSVASGDILRDFLRLVLAGASDSCVIVASPVPLPVTSYAYLSNV